MKLSGKVAIVTGGVADTIGHVNLYNKATGKHSAGKPGMARSP